MAGRIETLGRPDGPVRYTLFSARVPKENPWPHVRVVRFRGWPHLSIAIWELTASISLARALARVHADDPIDLVDLHAIGTSPLVVRWARKTGVPLLATCHSLRFFSTPEHGHRWDVARYYRWTNSLAFGNADAVVAVSHSIKEELLKFRISAERIVVLNAAASTDRLSPPQSRFGASRLEIAFVGRTSRDKGLDVLLDSLRRLLVENRDVRIWLTVVGEIAGDSPLRANAVRDGLPVDFVGALDNDSVKSLLARTDVVVVPSRYEPFGVICVEALIEGALVVASRVGGIPEIIEDGRTGVLVPPGDIEALAHVLERIARHPEAFEEIRKRNWEAGRKHTWSVRGPELLELYHNVIPVESAGLGYGDGARARQ
ncbi:MAG: glycosyltransferase family 4 protein [Fimbriimonadales bacterium]